MRQLPFKESAGVKPTQPDNSPDINELPMLATPAQVGSYTGIPINTLASWRFEGSHLPFVKMGRLVRYRRQDVLDFIQGSVYSSTAEAKAAV